MKTPNDTNIKRALQEARSERLSLFINALAEGDYEEIITCLAFLSEADHYVLAFSEAFGEAIQAIFWDDKDIIQAIFWDDMDIIKVYEKATSFHRYCAENGITFVK